MDGGAELVLADFRLIEYALSALDPSTSAILQRSEMKGISVYRRLLALTVGAGAGAGGAPEETRRH